ncbi:hypothetical protein GGR54DRAFT_422440 [Hypoxylon sp. NC1633]|nr:hypothetical protein GGR54DRAFT_422440 [Hypoxylon sp. NC1633]
MRTFIFFAGLLAALGVIAHSDPSHTGPRHARLPHKVMDIKPTVEAPLPCVAMDPLPSEEETQSRFHEFAEAFVVEMNITKSFQYVSSSYVNHNPMATQNGPGPAIAVLSQLFTITKLKPGRAAFDGDMSWLNYNASGFGEITDRFRWEAGCIVEHWDQGEKFPSNLTSVENLARRHERLLIGGR